MAHEKVFAKTWYQNLSKWWLLSGSGRKFKTKSCDWCKCNWSWWLYEV